MPHSSCHQMPFHTFPKPLVPLEHAQSYASHIDIDGSVKCLCIKGENLLWNELKVKGYWSCIMNNNETKVAKTAITIL